MFEKGSLILNLFLLVLKVSFNLTADVVHKDSGFS